MQLLKALALVATSAFVVACGGGSDIEDRLDVRDPVVRFIHAVPGAPNVTFFRGDSATTRMRPRPARRPAGDPAGRLPVRRVTGDTDPDCSSVPGGYGSDSQAMPLRSPSSPSTFTAALPPSATK